MIYSNIEINNKTISYSVKNSSENLSIDGEITIKQGTMIQLFKGIIKDENGKYLGEYYFCEPIIGKINKSINNIDITYLEEADSLITKTVNEIKQKLIEENKN